MPMLDATTKAPATDDQLATHLALYARLDNAERAAQLRTCTSTFAEWEGVAPNMYVPMSDIYSWAHMVATFDVSMDTNIWQAHLIQFTQIDRVLSTVFDYVEKVPYSTPGEWEDALTQAALKVPADKSDDLKCATLA